MVLDREDGSADIITEDDSRTLVYGVDPEIAAQIVDAVNLSERKLAEWVACGDAIMEALFGEKRMLSDSDVIGEVTRLRDRIAELEAGIERQRENHDFGDGSVADVELWALVK